MLKIGLTGGLGSGKTTVASIFEVLNVPVYYADDASKRLLNDNPVIKKAVINAFGPESYINGMPDRKYLARIVFNNQEKLSILNSILHPATLEDAAEWIKKQNSPYIIKEAALLFESGSNKSLDYVIGIKAPLVLRLQRAIKRDSISEKEVMSRINSQMDEEEKLKLCDFIIVNDEEQLLIPQVLKLHQQLVELSATTTHPRA
jgi:dephospho-CoA kinase